MRIAVLALTGVLFASPTLAWAEGPSSGNGDAQPERLAQRQGKASFNSDNFKGKKTATGEPFSQKKMTAAAKDLPLGSRVTVTNKKNGKSVNVEVTDRGPHVKGRVIDLSKTAAKKIGITPKDGLAPVKVEARPSSQPTEELKEAVRDKAAGPDGVVEAEGSATPQ
jgi:rare lipoprotein A